ncbi:MAG: type II secretion system GspH family protein [Synergistaceae bacterium]|nr:type II secretion system GspH family protein [Synergistaceae bacterium]
MSLRRGKRALKGYTVIEVMAVIIVIGILAGMVMLTMGSNMSRGESVVIMADLEAVKGAMLAYSMVNSTRTSDSLGTFKTASASAIIASLDSYLDGKARNSIKAQHFNNLFVDEDVDRHLWVGFRDFQANETIQSDLDKKVASSSAGFTGSRSGSTYTLSLKVK